MRQNSNTKPPRGGKPEKKKDRVNNSVSLDANNPIPFEYGGSAFEYISGMRYIPFLFGDDDFAKRLLEARLLSATQSACINTKSTFCAGQGMQDSEGKEFSPEFAAYLRTMNPKNQSATTLNNKAFDSFNTFGNVPIEVVEVTVRNKVTVYVYVHNFLEWRLGWPDSTGLVRYAVHSKLFLRQGLLTAEQIKNARQVPLFDISKPDSKKNWIEEKGVRRTMFWLKNETSGYDEYGMPQSIASLINQIMEYKGARYNLDNFENNMVIGGILALKGNLSQTEADKIGRTIIKSHTGDGRRGRVAVLSSEEGIEGSDYHEYDTTKDGSYIELDDKNMKKIIMSHDWHELLAGVDSGSALGKGNSYLRTVYQTKKKTVIDPAQRFLLENFWQPFQQILTKATGINAMDYKLEIIDIDPISSLSDIDPANFVQVNEARAEFGMVEDSSPKGKMYLSEMKKGSGSNPEAEKEEKDGKNKEDV